MSEPAEPLPVARWLRTGGEGLLVSLATLSAWPFASVEPFWEHLLTVGVGLLVALWTAHAVLTRRFTFRFDLVSLALAGLLLLTAVQLVPLPLGVVKVVSPGRAEWHESFIPERLERLPGEPDTPRPTALPLSVSPHHTRTLVARLLVLFAVYAAARNWLADYDTRRRFAWAAALNGVFLAILALGQFFSSPPGVAYWSMEVGGSLFGPFVCRNHYPDHLAFGIGGAITLLHRKKGERPPAGRAWRTRLLGLLDIFDRPASLFAAFALGLMLASIPFSQSRGGVAAVAVAGVGVAVLVGWGRNGVSVAVGVAAVVAVGLVLWLGVEPITERFRDDGHTLDDRTPLWSSGSNQLPGVWLFGGGGGTFQSVEPLGRITQPTNVSNDHAHNEYLEAIIEGGVIRLALTLLLAVGVPVSLARGYRNLRGRSAGAFAVGVGFAVVVLAVHSAVDFAVHMPAVAVMAATAVGLAGGGKDLTPRPPLHEWRGGVQPASASGSFRDGGEPVGAARSQARGEDTDQASHLNTPSPYMERGLVGEVLRFLLPLLLTLAVCVCALDARSRWRADQLRLVAEATTDTAARVELQSLRTRVAPSDSAAWFDLAVAHFKAGDSTAALDALRTARGLGPLHPDVHFHLGLHARQYQSADPPVVYFRRAARVLPTDPDVWYARGVEELNAGDRTAAEASWRRSLELSPKRLTPILKASATLPAEALRDRVLPDDPLVLMRAAAERPATERRVYVEGAATAVSRDGLTVPQLNAVAEACDELDRIGDAVSMWNRATTANPNGRDLRDAAARWFERQEHYSDAVPHLEWLADRSPTDTGLRDRLAAARHGAELKRVIGR